ncbi:MAG: hypothetical protein OEY51_09375 [Cyclobacteriaceae bacterium]|nr:hypothetical protein [Cyclobacteriaceae bacterium]
MKTQFAIFGTVVSLLAFYSGFAQQPGIQYWRPFDQDGTGIFESTKQDTIIYNGMKVRVGGAFAQQFQMLNHSTSFTSDEATGQLIEIKKGFNNATANLNIDVQLDDGVRLELITYLSARHHQEAWVKGGYIQFDKLPFNSAGLDKIMEYLTFKIGHMEINYGDAHFRRTDNGNAIYNPFVGNYIMDAFNTEIGAEAYVKASGFIGLLGVTEGEIKGDVKAGGDRSPSVYSKLGYDNQFTDDLRIRLTGSLYTTKESGASNYLYSGDRGGSRYYYVMEPKKYIDYRAGGAVTSTSSVNRPSSGRWNPGFSNSVTSVVINPFVKFKGLEVFGLYEVSKGAADNETTDRKVNQMAAEVIYRFLRNENIYVGARYNQVSGELSGSISDADITRAQFIAGWFINKHILTKLEYVKQNYNGFSGNLYENGQFDGVMIEAVIGF